MKKAWIVALSILGIILPVIIFISSASSANKLTTLQRKNEQLELSISQLQAAVDTTQTPIDVADLYSGVNNERTKRGLATLNIDIRLEVSACAKAHDMSAKNYWSHIAPDGTTPWDFITSAGYQYANSGENLAKNYNKASDAIVAWVNSPTHLENITGDFKDMGICVIQSNKSQLSSSTKPANVIVNHFGRQ